MIRLQEVSWNEQNKWNRLVSSFPNSTIFHTLEWLRIIHNNQGVKVKKIGIFIDRELIGVFPLCIKSFLCLRVGGSPFVVEDTPYLGPLNLPSYTVKMYSALDAYLKKKRISFIRILSNQVLSGREIGVSYGVFERHTHILDISQSKNALWKNLEGRCRTAIRKAWKSGVVVNVATNRDFVEEYYSILKEVYHAQKMPCPNRKAFYYDMWDSFSGSNALFLSAEYHGEIIAGIIMIVDGKRAYYLNGVSKRKLRSLSATNLLLWEAIGIAKERDVEQFDFVGSDIDRLAKFKKSFGGNIAKYTLIEKASSDWISFIRNYYPNYKIIVGNIVNKLQGSGRS